MADTVQNRRGPKERLPQLADAELGLCQDTEEVFVGNRGRNLPLLTLTQAAGRALGFDPAPVQGSDSLISSGAVFAALKELEERLKEPEQPEAGTEG